MDTRIWLAAEIIVSLQQNLKESRQILFTELRRCALQGRALVRCGGNQVRVCAANTRDQKIAHMADSFAAEVLQIAPFFLKGVYQAESAVRRTRSNRADQFLKRVV